MTDQGSLGESETQLIWKDTHTHTYTSQLGEFIILKKKKKRQLGEMLESPGYYNPITKKDTSSAWGGCV